MASTLKIVLASLTTVFAVAAMPAVAYIAESHYEARKASQAARQISDEMLNAVGLEERPDSEALLAGYRGCLDQFAHPAHGKAAALYNWSGRLSFLPNLSSLLLTAADQEAQYSMMANARCVQDTVKKILIPDLQTLPPGGRPVPPGKNPWLFMT